WRGPARHPSSRAGPRHAQRYVGEPAATRRVLRGRRGAATGWGVRRIGLDRGGNLGRPVSDWKHNPSVVRATRLRSDSDVAAVMLFWPSHRSRTEISKRKQEGQISPLKL